MQDITTTDGRLKPANGHEITEQLHLLFASLPLQAGSDPKTALSGYLIAMQGRPCWAIENAVRKFLRGEIAGASRKFCPRPPELAEAVVAEMAHVYEEIDTLRKREAVEEARRAQIAERYTVFPDEHRLRMKFNFTVLLAGMERHNPDAVANAWNKGQAAMIDLGRAWGLPIPEGLINVA